ncbi:hypothetical protein F5Y16DRAFT_397421 [Xylariaceae sp. FL0255]|nr:hypothetical protein F5Y16DRAFT_397421 [Xylariaceae sp. FL0255]
MSSLDLVLPEDYETRLKKQEKTIQRLRNQLQLQATQIHHQEVALAMMANKTLEQSGINYWMQAQRPASDPKVDTLCFQCCLQVPPAMLYVYQQRCHENSCYRCQRHGIAFIKTPHWAKELCEELTQINAAYRNSKKAGSHAAVLKMFENQLAELRMKIKHLTEKKGLMVEIKS